MPNSGFVHAYDPITKARVVVPEHFLGEDSPFPQLKPLPSSRRDTAATDSADKTAAKPRRTSGTTTGRQAQAAATDKEK